MTAAGRLTFSPTRHTLILLPLFCAIAGEGLCVFEWFSKFVSPETALRWQKFLSYVISAAVLLLFFVYYGTFLSDRRDPFIEKEIVEVLKKYDVNEILADKRSVGVDFMKKVKEYLAQQDQNGRSYDTIAHISRYPVSLTLKDCDLFREQFNLQLFKDAINTGKQTVFVKHSCSDYHLIYKKKIESDVQIDFSKRIKTDIYSNRMYFSIYSVKDKTDRPVSR
jgi:hypothetical protein